MVDFYESNLIDLTKIRTFKAIQHYNQLLIIIQMQVDLSSQINRILSADTNKDLLSQIKHIQSYENQIQRQLNIKSQQILQLHTQLKKQIQNICTVVKENQSLKLENNRLKQEISNLKHVPIITHRQQPKVILPKVIPKANHETQTSKRDLKDKECQTSILQLIQLQPRSVPKEQASIQTQTIIQNDQNRLLKKIQQLQDIITTLKCQKYDLEKRIRQISVSQQYSSIDGTPSQDQLITETQTDEVVQILNLVKQLQREEVTQVRYIGELSDEMKIKKGVCQYQNGLVYNGEFTKGKREGKGILSYKNIVIYQGYWKNNEFNGRGTLFLFENLQIQSFSGNFVNGKRHGYGTLTFKSGRRLISEWCNESIVGNSLSQTNNSLKYGKMAVN